MEGSKSEASNSKGTPKVLLGAAISFIKSQTSKIPRSVRARRANFKSFPELPTELRLQIWRYTMSDSRFLELKYGVNQNDCLTDASNDLCGLGRHWVDMNLFGYAWRVNSNQRPPIALAACRESRYEAMRKYWLRLHTMDRDCYLRVDPHNDILYVPSIIQPFVNQKALFFGTIYKSEALKSIRHLAVDVSLCGPGPWTHRLEIDGKSRVIHDHHVHNYLWGYKALKTVLLVSDTEVCDEEGGESRLEEVDPDLADLRMRDLLTRGMQHDKILDPEYSVPEVKIVKIVKGKR